MLIYNSEHLLNQKSNKLIFISVLLGKVVHLYRILDISASPPPCTYSHFKILLEKYGVRCSTYTQFPIQVLHLSTREYGM